MHTVSEAYVKIKADLSKWEAALVAVRDLAQDVVVAIDKFLAAIGDQPDA